MTPLKISSAGISSLYLQMHCSGSCVGLFLLSYRDSCACGLSGDLFILVYSVDSRESFDEVQRLLGEIYEAKGQHSGVGAAPTIRSGGGGDPQSGTADRPVIRRGLGKRGPPMVIVGNKCDRDVQQRAVTVGELQDLVDTMPNCVGMEVSALLNHNVEEVFVQLFVLARLPTEMSPSQHRRVPITYVGGGSAKLKKGVSLDGDSSTAQRSGSARVGTSLLRRQLSDACGAVAPNVRRPSIRTDLLLLQTRTRAAATGSGGLGGFRATSGSDKEIHLIRKDSGRCVVQ